jgi:hypothetical protein
MAFAHALRSLLFRACQPKPGVLRSPVHKIENSLEWSCRVNDPFVLGDGPQAQKRKKEREAQLWHGVYARMVMHSVLLIPNPVSPQIPDSSA